MTVLCLDSLAPLLIGSQQKISEMSVKLDAARLLTWKAAAARDAGENYTKEAAMAKLFASEAATFCSHAVRFWEEQEVFRPMPSCCIVVSPPPENACASMYNSIVHDQTRTALPLTRPVMIALCSIQQSQRALFVASHMDCPRRLLSNSFVVRVDGAKLQLYETLNGFCICR